MAQNRISARLPPLAAPRHQVCLSFGPTLLFGILASSGDSESIFQGLHGNHRAEKKIELLPTMKLRTALAIGLSCLVEGTGADLDTGSVAARRKLRGRSRGSRDLVSVSNDLVSNDVNFDGLLSLTSTSDAAEAEEGATATTPPTEAAEIATDPPAAPRTVCSSIIAVSAAYSPNATYADLAGRLVPHGDEGAAAAEVGRRAGLRRARGRRGRPRVVDDGGLRLRAPHGRRAADRRGGGSDLGAAGDAQQ
ncbi:hypothetical protein THAOC_17542, partial [Thalassiosira oceanica]